MKYGMKRFYYIFNREPGPSYYAFDRTTGEKIHEGWDKDKAIKLVDEKNAEDAKAKGIDLTDAVETPSNYYGTRNGTPREIAPMVRHGGPAQAAEPEAAVD
jgi:hypothetical protein